MCYWTFSNVFEEDGVPKGVFNAAFGMLDQWGIARPSLHAFAFLHKLGDRQLYAGDGPVLATQRADGSIALLAWNLIPEKESGAITTGNPEETGADSQRSKGADLTLHLRFSGLAGRKQALVSQINSKAGCALPAWKAMGNPRNPSQAQLQQLRVAAELPKPAAYALTAGEPSESSIALPPNGVALLEL
jgi:xylan 1,4-beta-xylosidase